MKAGVSYGLFGLFIKRQEGERLWSVWETAFCAVFQRPCGKRVLCVFHRLGTIHGLPRVSSTVQDAPGATNVGAVDPVHPLPSARDHGVRLPERRVSGSRIVGPFSVSLWAR
jgi:hypothetical protein